MLKCAIIGLGHGSSYAHLIDKHEQSELVAVVDKSSDAISSIQSTYPTVNAYDSYDTLLDEEKELDAVIIALPTAFHADAAIKALNAGKHVHLEKPLCLNDDEANAIRDAVNAHPDLIFQLGYEMRHSPFHQCIMKHSQNGDLGQITNVWYNMHCLDKHNLSWRTERAQMGGKLFDCAVHTLDLMQQWAGAPVHRLFAMGNLLNETGTNTDDLPQSAIIAVEYENGVRGSYNFGQVNDVNDDSSCGIVGTTGRIKGNPWLPEGSGSFELRTHKGVYKSDVVFDGTLTSQGHLGFNEQWDNLVGCILNDGPNYCDIDAACAVHRMMVAIDTSLSTGEVITF